MVPTVMRPRRFLAARGLLLLLGAVLLPCAAGQSFAQPYPARLVRVIVPFAAGGTPDVVGRIVSQRLAAQTGRSAESRSDRPASATGSIWRPSCSSR
jgi:tripartite-type tricarboxylate transporter receptor subunit TctC